MNQNVKLFLENLFSNINIHQCWFINKSSRSQMFYRMDVRELQNSQESNNGAVYFFHEIALTLFAVCKFI